MKIEKCLFYGILIFITGCDIGLKKEKEDLTSSYYADYNEVLKNTTLKESKVINSEPIVKDLIDTEKAISEILLEKYSNYEWREISNLIREKRFDETFQILKTALRRTKDKQKKEDINDRIVCIELIEKFGYDDAHYSNSKNFIITVKNEKYGLLYSLDKHLLFEPYFQLITDGFQSNFLLVQQDEKYGLLDSDAKTFLPIEYEDIDVEECLPLIAIKKNGKYAFLNSKGKMVIPYKYEAIEPLWNCGAIVVCENDKLGLIDTLGKLLYKPQFDDFAEGDDDNTIRVLINGDEKIIKIRK